MTVRVLEGDCRDVLKTLPDESVHCVVTSPPYFGLRDYGVDGQIGLEDSPQVFVAALVAVFEEVRRVLRADGTAWVNIGDSYAGSWGAQSRPQGATGEMAGRSIISVGAEWGLKPKDLMLVPFRLALALQAAGWWVRQDIIWAKPNPMPESVLDRCTKAHEYIFLLSKSERYYYDADAIKEEAAPESAARYEYAFGGAKSEALIEANKTGIGQRTRVAGKRSLHMRETQRNDGDRWREADGGVAPRGVRNKRSVWEVATTPFTEAHFATFPVALIEPCILAGCPAGGTVLDPFGGAGTTGLVADRHGRDAILIELNPEYAEMARKRITNDSPLFAEVS